jgi:putative phosphoribosyl transferase
VSTGVFRDRIAAGRRLGRRLAAWQDADAVVLGLPRGGVPVAFEVAMALRLPLDVVVVRKLGVPGNPELAMGAVGEDGATIINAGVVTACRVSDRDVASAAEAARAEVDRRARLLRPGRPRLPVRGRAVIVVDDGAATGATARVGCRVARELGATRVVVAVPVASVTAAAELAAVADEVVCLLRPDPFGAVGRYYEDFAPTTDAEVTALLDRAGAEPG